MKSMERFGNPLFSYEGVGSAEVGVPGDPPMKVEGYFEAAQFATGRLAVSVVPIKGQPPTTLSLRTDPSMEISFRGMDVDGWVLQPKGETFFSQISWMLAFAGRQPREHTFSAQYLEAKQEHASSEGYTEATFLVSNLLWGINSEEEPAPIRLELSGAEVTIKPVDAYLEISQRLRQNRGAEPTALIHVKRSLGDRQHLREFGDFVEELLYVLRLITGNQILWWHGEAVDNQLDRAVERIHRHSVPGSYSTVANRLLFPNGQVNLISAEVLHQLAEAFWDDANSVLDKVDLHKMVNLFVSACEPNLALEAAGLMASTLVELIAAKYVGSKGELNEIPETEFRKVVLPLLESAVDGASIGSEPKLGLKNNLTGLYRKSLPRKLRELNAKLDLGLATKDIRRIARIRNSLAHEGTFPSSFQDGGWEDDYAFMIWTDFRALCRLSGYQGELPQALDQKTMGV